MYFDVCTIGLNKKLDKIGLKLGLFLASGSFGQVYTVYKETELFGVIKISRANGNFPQSIIELEANADRSLSKEFFVMSKTVNSKNTVKLKHNHPITYSNFTGHYSAIIMEALLSICDIEECVNDWVKTFGLVPVTSKIGCDLLSGLNECCHEGMLMHRDLKPENIFALLGISLKDTVFRIGDFGLCHLMGSCATKSVNIRDDDDIFKAPDRCHDLKSDIYSIGAILCKLCKFTFRGAEGKNGSNYSVMGEIGDVIKRMISTNPEDRPELSECLDVFRKHYHLYEKAIETEYNNVFLVNEFLLKRINTSENIARIIESLHSESQKTRLSAVYSYVNDDIASATLTLKTLVESSSDSVASYYLASIYAKQGYSKESIEILNELRYSLSKTHPLYDRVLALLMVQNVKLSRNEKMVAEIGVLRPIEPTSVY